MSTYRWEFKVYFDNGDFTESWHFADTIVELLTQIGMRYPVLSRIDIVRMYAVTI